MKRLFISKICYVFFINKRYPPKTYELNLHTKSNILKKICTFMIEYYIVYI